VRSSFLAATYLFEVGYQRVNLINGPFMLFVFFHLILLEKSKTKRRYYTLGMVMSVVTIILVHSRTMWIISLIGICLTPFFIKQEERKRAYWLFGKLTLLFIAAVSLLYLLFPFFGIILKFLLAHLLSSSNLRTDPSLVGRYIEWRYVWGTISESPLVGYGSGNIYRLYNWFGGYFLNSAYTHNGYLGVLLKGGLIGFILLYISYIGFIIKGFVLLKTKSLMAIERAFIRAGLSILLLLTLATNTFNMFSHRDVLLYVGIIWGYFLYIDRTTLSNINHIKTKTSISD
jgi:O-antigen ligase